MSAAGILILLQCVWAAFGGYWLVAARGGEVEHTAESPFYRPVRLAILVITFTLLFSRRLAFGFLGRQLMPRLVVVACVGFALTLTGLALAMWARTHLGRYWSDKVVLKVNHQLVQDGPYAYMRHPIYSGVLLGVAGTALVVDEWRGALAFLVLLANYWIKAVQEEKILSAGFGEQFANHKRRAGFLFPRLRARGPTPASFGT